MGGMVTYGIPLWALLAVVCWPAICAMVFGLFLLAWYERQLRGLRAEHSQLLDRLMSRDYSEFASLRAMAAQHPTRALPSEEQKTELAYLATQFPQGGATEGAE